METLQYIDNDINKGLKYNFKKIFKEFKKLNVPGDVHTPLETNLARNKYIVEMSERSVGKTTNWLLLGLCMFKLYGTQMQYIRQNQLMITPSNLKDLFSVILEYDYISKLTDGEYNTVYYFSKRYYLAYYDEDSQEITKKCDKHFMMLLSLDRQEYYKSSYNAPYGDLIIFDEFISKSYFQNEFVEFMQLLKTIQRERLSPIVVMLANTIDKHSQYLHELEIYDIVDKMEVGEHIDYTTELGTNISINLVEPSLKLKKKKETSNRTFYGFKNSALNSIRGGGWDLPVCQHIPSGMEYDIIVNNLYIYHNNKYLKLDIVTNVLGTCIYVHWATYSYDDSIILTVQDLYDGRYIYGLGTGGLEKLLKHMLSTNKVFYATNDCKSFFDNYLKQIK